MNIWQANIWQADFYRRPLQDASGNSLWELIICDADENIILNEFVSQKQANVTWLTQQLRALSALYAPDRPPDRLQVFRPQALALLQTACQPLNIAVEPTRRTSALKQLLQKRLADYRNLPLATQEPYDPIKLDIPPPVPLPENLWGDQWRFGAIAAQNLIPAFQSRPVPVREMPEALYPENLQLMPATPVPGVIIDAGRKSRSLTQWLQQAKPFSLNYISGDPDGLILEAGLVDRWILSTFSSPFNGDTASELEIATSAQNFSQRQQTAKGLHFLLVQPDNSGMTYSGIWLMCTS